MAAIRWTLQALDDLEAICLFIARDSPRVAAVFAERVFQATDRLAENPRLGRAVPELSVPTIRQLNIGNYRVIYRIQAGDIQVLTVHHGARLLDIRTIEETE